MKVLVCGGRNFLDWSLLKEVLDDLFDELGLSCIIQGGAKGADFLAKVYASELQISCKEYPANWKKYGKGAGCIRNQEMLDESKPDYVVAFYGGSGTKDMVKRALKVLPRDKVITVGWDYED